MSATTPLSLGPGASSVGAPTGDRTTCGNRFQKLTASRLFQVFLIVVSHKSSPHFRLIAVGFSGTDSDPFARRA